MRSVIERAKEAKPPGKTGRPEKGTQGVPLSKGSNDRRIAQIAKRRPDILDRMKAGEFKSVRAAALEGGRLAKFPKPGKQISPVSEDREDRTPARALPQRTQ